MIELVWRRGRTVPASRLSIVAGGLVGLTLVFYVFQGAVDFTPAVLPPARNEVVHITRQIAPQGWAFFTKDAQSEYVVPYAVSGQELTDRSIPVGASARWSFGFNRTGRTQGAEIATFLQGLSKKDWTPCHTATSCRAVLATAPRPVDNPRTAPSLCGRLVLIAERPVPWEWRKLRSAERLTEAIYLDARC